MTSIHVCSEKILKNTKSNSLEKSCKNCLKSLKIHLFSCSRAFDHITRPSSADEACSSSFWALLRDFSSQVASKFSSTVHSWPNTLSTQGPLTQCVLKIIQGIYQRMRLVSCHGVVHVQCFHHPASLSLRYFVNILPKSTKKSLWLRLNWSTVCLKAKSLHIWFSICSPLLLTYIRILQQHCADHTHEYWVYSSWCVAD